MFMFLCWFQYTLYIYIYKDYVLIHSILMTTTVIYQIKFKEDATFYKKKKKQPK